jgi:hypothetical protein
VGKRGRRHDQPSFIHQSADRPRRQRLERRQCNAIGAAFALAGGGAAIAAAQFTFDGRSYLAIAQTPGDNAFVDANDLLLDITGVAGTIDAGDFTTF